MTAQDMTTRNAEIIRLYVEEGLHSRQIAPRFGITPIRVLQILNAAGVKTRGRRTVVTDEQCARSFAAFVAEGGTAIHHYAAFQRRNPWAVSVGTLRNRGYDFTAIPNHPRSDYLYSNRDVTLPSAPAISKAAVGRWVVENSAESAKVVSGWLGAKFRARSMPARPRGWDEWSMSHLDRIMPDLTCKGDHR